MTEDPESPAAAYYKVYEEHSRTLRTWLVAYGAGVPILLLSNEKLWEKLSPSGIAPQVMKLFLWGIALQAALSALNKLLMWALYYGETNAQFKRKRRYRVANWLSDQMWIDFLVDVTSVFLFAVATQRLARIVLA